MPPHRPFATVLLLFGALLAAACSPRNGPELAVVPDDTTGTLTARQREALEKSRKLRLHRDYDRITGRTTVSLPLLDDGGLRGAEADVVASFAFPGDSLIGPPETVQLTVDWVDLSGATHFAESPSANFLVDDSLRFEAPGRDYKRYVDQSVLQLVFQDSSFRQRVVLDLAGEDFARIAGATRLVEARLTSGTSFRLRAEHLLALRRLAAAMEPEDEAF